MSGFLEGNTGGGGPNTPTGPAGGDLGGTYPDPTVTDIQGNPVQAVTLGATQDGYVLTWVFADGKLEFKPSPSGTLYSHFFALMPGDNSATIAANAPIFFPQNGPSTGAASSLGSGLFNLPTIGTYEINWQASIAESGQLQLAIGGVGLPDTVVGRANGTTQIVGFAIITTTVDNSVLSVINPAGNTPALTLTTTAGGTHAVSATLTIKFNVSGSGGVPGVPPTGPALGDLSGNYPDPIVVGLQGHAISSSAPTTGNGLYWSGSLWTPGALNLAGGINFVTGVLPTGSQAAQSLTLTGDVTGSGTTAGTTTTVVNIHGASVPAAGALTTGNVLQVAGVSTLSYGAINLAGGANFVTGALPNANQAAQTMSGDVTGTTAASTVAKIQGNPVTAQTLGASQDGYVLTWNAPDWLALPTNSIISSAVAAAGTAAYNPTWYAATDIYWDPANLTGFASNNNTGTSAGSGGPLLTFAEIVRRYGAYDPIMNIGQNVTIHKLSAQTLNVDPVFFMPKLSGGGYAALIDTLVVFSGPTTAGTVTLLNQTAGTDLTVASMPAGTTAGMLVFNSTKGGYAFVTAMNSTTATMSQPMSTANVTTVGLPATTTGTNWATGDTITIYNIPNLTNLKVWRPTGGDVSAGGTPSVGWVQFTQIADSSGTGAGMYPMVCDSASNVLSCCYVAARLHISTLVGRGFGVFVLSSYMNAPVLQYAGEFMISAGYLASTFATSGGVPELSANVTIFGNSTIAAAYGLFSNVHFAGSLVIEGSTVNFNGPLFGAGALTLNPMGVLLNGSGGTFASNLLMSGAIKIGANTTGYTSPSGGTFTLNGITQVNVTGTFPANAPIAWSLNTVGSTPGVVGPYFSQAQANNNFYLKSGTALANDVYNWQALPASVSLTVANMDLYNGLQDPNTGARFCFAQ